MGMLNMYADKKIIAIIPARGGSKGLTDKNIKDLCGKPLIAHTIQSAQKSKYLDEIIVTTDSQKIADIASKFGANIPFLRPDKLASDTSTSVDVVIHTLDFYKNNLAKEYDYIMLLEPTSPLREDADIDNMIEKLIDNSKHYDSICSIGEIGEHPSIVKKIQNDTLVPFCSELQLTTRRQDNEAAYFPYGVGYLVKTDTFYKEKTFYTQRNYFYKIQRYQCYEIDDIYDFLAVENILKYKMEKYNGNKSRTV
jgi:CMP-N-acetylneuraminic acid synthetase